MMSIPRLTGHVLSAGALLLTLAGPVTATPFVSYTTQPVDGFFQYNLFLSNPDPDFIVTGFVVVHGFSVFGLGPGSIIGAPEEVHGCPCNAWGFFEPIPPFADSLAYFSPGDAGDVLPGETLGGFFFRSTTNPATLRPGDFEIEIHDRLRGDLSIGDARPVPEPASVLLLGFGLAACARRVVSRRAGDQ